MSVRQDSLLALVSIHLKQTKRLKRSCMLSPSLSFSAHCLRRVSKYSRHTLAAIRCLPRVFVVTTKLEWNKTTLPLIYAVGNARTSYFSPTRRCPNQHDPRSLSGEWWGFKYNFCPKSVLRWRDEHDVSISRCPSANPRFEASIPLRNVIRWRASGNRSDWPVGHFTTMLT